MQSLKKVTSEFVEAEDRFRLSALTTEDKAVAFWLTQRLLTRLVSHLSKQLEMGSSRLGNKPKAQEDNNSDRDIEANHESFAAQSAVKIEKKFKPILITEVDVKIGKSGLTLVLKSDNKSCASVYFSLSELKQWLEILYTLWHRAGWPISLWPQQLRNSTSIKEVSTNTIH